MSIETGLFSFWLSIVSLLRSLVVCIITVLWKLKTKSGKKQEQRIISPKNHENFKDSKPRVVLLVLIKKSVLQQEENHYSVIKGVLYRSDDATCFFLLFSEQGSFCLQRN